MTALPALAAEDAELRHGFTLAEVSRLTVLAVRRYRLHRLTDYDQRLEVGWHAMVELIYSCDEPPAEGELFRAVWSAISDDVARSRRFRGRNMRDLYAGTTTGFEAYWWTVSRPAGHVEERVTELLAVAQIWPALSPANRRALAALAAHQDYGRAADALGQSSKTFISQVSRARREFLALWHEGEAPSRPWRKDAWRADSGVLAGADRRSITNRTIVRRRQAARRAAQNGTPTPPPRRGTSKPRDLGVSNAEIVRRYQGGESLRQLATSLGASHSTVRDRLVAQGVQLRSMGRMRQHKGGPGSGSV